MLSYFAATEDAHVLLVQDFSIKNSALTQDDLSIASEEVDRFGPFKGRKRDPSQPHAFPRTFVNPIQHPRGVLVDEPGEVPFGVLAWVALRAHELSEQRAGYTDPGGANWWAHTASIRSNLLYSLKT